MSVTKTDCMRWGTLAAIVTILSGCFLSIIGTKNSAIEKKDTIIEEKDTIIQKKDSFIQERDAVIQRLEQHTALLEATMGSNTGACLHRKPRSVAPVSFDGGVLNPTTYSTNLVVIERQSHVIALRLTKVTFSSDNGDKESHWYLPQLRNPYFPVARTHVQPLNGSSLHFAEHGKQGIILVGTDGAVHTGCARPTTDLQYVEFTTVYAHRRILSVRSASGDDFGPEEDGDFLW